MAAVGKKIGTGLTISFSTATYAANITNFSQGDESVPVIDTTHMGTSGSRTKTTGELIDHGSFDVDIELDYNLLGNMKSSLGTSQTVTVNFPLSSGTTGTPQASGTAAMTSHNYTLPLEDRCIANYTVTWLDAVTFTAATTT
jgi:hypothetical protein